MKPQFLKRAIVKALCARLPELTWTLLATIPSFIFANIYFQEIFGDAGINLFLVNMQFSIILSLVISALVSDFVPGFSVYLLNELYWEGTRSGLAKFKHLQDLEAAQ